MRPIKKLHKNIGLKTVKDMINELNIVLENFGNLPLAVTEEVEAGKPLAPLGSVAVLEAGLTDDSHHWINDEHDTVCVLSSSRIEDVLGRITANM